MRTNLFKTLAVLASTSIILADDGTAAKSVMSDVMFGLCTIFAAITALFLGLYYWGERKRKKTELALSESELHALHILNGARDAIISVSEDGYVESFNPAAVMMFGCTAKEAVGKSILTFLPPPERAAGRDNHLQAGSSGRNLTGLRADGSEFPVDLVMNQVNVNTRRIFSIFVRDVSTRNNTETALETERNFSAAVLDSAGALVVVMDHEGRIVKFNRACEETTDYSYGEIKNRPVWEIFASPEEFEAMREATLDMIDGDFPSRSENIWRTRDLTPRRISWSHTALRDKLGRIEHVVSIGNDVTERRALETQLVQARKMEAIGRLAGGVAHDFNNLLTAITGYSDLILHSVKDNDPIRRDVEEIKRAGDRATALTRQLLAFSRKQVLAPQVLNLNNIITGTGRMLNRLLGEEIEVEMVLDHELKPIKADAGQLDQVLLNLALNARDAMPAGGSLTIETANITLGTNNMRTDPVIGPGSYVMLRVVDSGSGMDQETLSHIFEPFFTTKEHGKGTGLGLATVYGIVRQSNAAISVSSLPGRGSCFTIFFPLAGAAEILSGGQDELTKAMQGSETILLVEDQEEVRRMMVRALENSGYQVLEAHSGNDALDRARHREGPIHLMLSDIVMPGMNGPELARRIASERPEMRTLFMSGHALDVVEKHGVDFYVEKPVKIDALARRVREVLDAPPKKAMGMSAGK